MILGTFDIAIDTPKRHKRGTLELKSSGEAIDAHLVVKDVLDKVFSGTCSGQEFDIAGTDEFPDMGRLDYRAHGSVWGNSVSVKCQTDAGAIELFGTRISASTGDFKSSHDYIMSSAAGGGADGEGIMYSGLYSDGS